MMMRVFDHSWGYAFWLKISTLHTEHSESNIYRSNEISLNENAHNDAEEQ